MILCKRTLSSSCHKEKASMADYVHEAGSVFFFLGVTGLLTLLQQAVGEGLGIDSGSFCKLGWSK